MDSCNFDVIEIKKKGGASLGGKLGGALGGMIGGLGGVIGARSLMNASVVRRQNFVRTIR